MKITAVLVLTLSTLNLAGQNLPSQANVHGDKNEPLKVGDPIHVLLPVNEATADAQPTQVTLKFQLVGASAPFGEFNVQSTQVHVEGDHLAISGVLQGQMLSGKYHLTDAYVQSQYGGTGWKPADSNDIQVSNPEGDRRLKDLEEVRITGPAKVTR